jgi:hypothetical protein
MTNTFRALCAELLDCDDGAIFGTDLVTRTRAALAQTEPVAPTDEELRTMWLSREWFNEGATLREFASIIRRWGTPAIQPVPVSERLPPMEADELDDQGTCWNYHPINLHYCLCVPDPSVHTHWLSANALPTPEATNA